MVSASSAGASAGASVSVVSSTTSSGAAGASVDSSSVASVSVAASSVSGVVASVDLVSSAVSSVVTSSVPVAASVPVASSVPVPSVGIVSLTMGMFSAAVASAMMPSAIAWTLEDCITMAMVRTATSATFHLFIVWRRVALWPSRLSLIQTTIPSCLGRRPTTPACLHAVREQSAPTAHFGVTVTQKAVGGIFLFCLLNSALRAF